MEYKFTGIVLGKYNVGEADRIYTIYTLEKGKIKALAKGVRKSQARLAGNLENFSLVDLAIAKGKGTGKITGSIVENNFRNLRNNLEALGNVFEAVKILDKLTGLEEKDADIFNLLESYLKTADEASLEKEEKISLITRGFILKLLDCLGYKIEAKACVKCSSAFPKNGNYFSAEKGGIVCTACSKEAGNKIAVSDNTIKIIRIFFQNKLKSLLKLKVTRKEIDNLKMITNDFIQWIAK
jgi:DNA repair protein RecO (recombination protein O)